MVAGRVQVYEINTNPFHGDFREVLRSAHPERRSLLTQAETELTQALHSLSDADRENGMLSLPRQKAGPKRSLRRNVRRSVKTLLGRA